MFDWDLEKFIETVGYVGIFAIIFSETGLLIGFFLPGDTLLISAGLLASREIVNIWVVVLVCFTAAVTGDATGYAIGHKVGRRLFQRPESRLFKPENVERAERFFQKHGGKAVILARFVPFVRTFVPVVAGVGAMRYRYFALYNVVGALLWAVGLSLFGYYLGDSVPGLDKYIVPLALGGMVLSLIPSLIHLFRENRSHARSAVRRGVDRAGEGQTIE
jgi:membrane-associated protein